ncbi:hypothetical protein [Paenisporosarcina sp. OV554]|uniref:hypothetical protein n=1 Tax=Paenisporosarcina sp. OV554 TaxID=2135694 RepID=UPI001304EB52
MEKSSYNRSLSIRIRIDKELMMPIATSGKKKNRTVRRGETLDVSLLLLVLNL